MTGEEKPVLLLIADISGYTRFMVANRETLAHAQVIINDLVSALLHRVDLPLEVAKLEGDAVFLYALHERLEAEGGAAKTVRQKLVEFYDAFCDTLEELYRGNLCHCEACRSLGDLRLKIVLHSGTALFYRIGRFEELSGPDVIVVHRLVKNSVRSDQYILMTEGARSLLDPDGATEGVRGSETYDGIGTVTTYVYAPARTLDLPAEGQPQASFWYRFGREWSKYVKALPYRLGLKRVVATAGGREVSGAG
jgi:class 3 adenylate cyclase